ncbi:MAG TPA: hypothetical protein VJ761_14610 [Ktedonobacteraceae bacterium]|nr:hypothetical protein [Ktedonobacteraceae bacterium]
METNMFDEVTKALATSTTRRQALRRIGGILGGTALAGLFPGLALANNSPAAHFCNAVFGADTLAAQQCTSDAAHHTGLYYNSSCGGNPQSVCCPTNPDGTCTSYSSATCCGSGQTCTNGTCATACAQLSNGTQPTCCHSDNDCCGGFCQTDVSGLTYCTNGPLLSPCNVDADCPLGQFCTNEALYLAGTCRAATSC